MSEGKRQEVETKKWKAGNEFGRALKDEDEKKAPVDKSLRQRDPVPLFMRDSSEGHQLRGY
jgi:hypothetical protein